MADFEKFYPLLKPNEGGYLSAAMALQKNDRGGETYKGIARNFNGDWEGWKIIDAYKVANGVPAWNSYIKSEKLDALVKERAKKNYWDAHRFSQIKNQSVANAIADFTFNSGTGSKTKSGSIHYVQKILNLPIDGVAGPQTISAINRAPQKWLLDKITEARVQMIQNSGAINPDFKPQLIKRAKSFFFSTTTRKITTFAVLGLSAGLGLLALYLYRDEN